MSDSLKTPVNEFQPLFAPASVAVVGASSSGVGLGNLFIRLLQDFGFSGPVYPIHPKASAIEGLAAYPTLGAAPTPIDYAYVTVPAGEVPGVIREARGRVRFAQVVSSGFGETAEGEALEELLLQAARTAEVRIVGPNCLGTYSPRGKLTYVGGLPSTPGTVGLVSQSGGLSVDILRRGVGKGIRFSGMVTLGNSIDVGPSDILAFYLEDPATRVIGLYLEDVKDGRRFFELLRSAQAAKPIVLLVGGRTALGRRAASSHTGALATDERIWLGLAKQTGAYLVDSLEDLLAALIGFQAWTEPRQQPPEQIVLFGNGGGASVLATDCFARRGLQVAPFAETTRQNLIALNLPPGSTVTNPIDTPVGVLRVDGGRVAGRIAEIVLAQAHPDALVVHVNLASLLEYSGSAADVLENLTQSVLEARTRHHPPTPLAFVLRSDGSRQVDALYRSALSSLHQNGIPAFAEFSEVTVALQAVHWYEHFRLRGAATG